MKKIQNFPMTIVVSCLVYCLIVAFLESCSKHEQTDNGNFHELKSPPLPPYWITIQAKPYRETESRPRDGKACICTTCLGVCDLVVKPGGPTFIIVPDDTTSGTGQARIYLLDSATTYLDPEFGIDSAINIPGTYANDTTLWDYITLMTGEYTFTQQIDTVTLGSTPHYSWGYADININKVP